MNAKLKEYIEFLRAKISRDAMYDHVHNIEPDKDFLDEDQKFRKEIAAIEKQDKAEKKVVNK